MIRCRKYNAYDVGAKDDTILAKAAQEQSIILTFDRDYGELIYKHKLPKPLGIVYFREQPNYPEEPAELFLKLNISIAHCFTILEHDRVRQRPL